MDNGERTWVGITFLLVLCIAIAQHFMQQHEQELAVACKAQTGYTEHKKTGRNWYCKASEWSSSNSTEQWQKLRRN